MTNVPAPPNRWLLLGGFCSAIAALLHIGVIFGGPDWYRVFGAGEAMAQLAEQGHWYPTMITSVITMFLVVLTLYAWSGAGIIRRLPLLRTGLCMTIFVYLARGIGGFIIALFIRHESLQTFTDRPLFMWVTSIICTLFGMCYLIGTRQRWRELKPASR